MRASRPGCGSADLSGFRAESDTFVQLSSGPLETGVHRATQAQPKLVVPETVVAVHSSRRVTVRPVPGPSTSLNPTVSQNGSASRLSG